MSRRRRNRAPWPNCGSFQRLRCHSKTPVDRRSDLRAPIFPICPMQKLNFLAANDKLFLGEHVQHDIAMSLDGRCIYPSIYLA